MNGSIAFGGDPRVQADLLARIDRHLAAGTLIFGDTGWDGVSGSALGVSIEGADPAAYAAAYGYPLPLAGLLDAVTRYAWGGFDRPAFVRAWVSVVRPGADLAPVPTMLMLSMLDDARLRVIDDPLADALARYHRRDLDGPAVARAEWADLRQAILDEATDPGDRPRHLAVRMWEAAAWPAARGRSTLTGALEAWGHLQTLIDDPTWSAADEARKDRVLETIQTDHAGALEAGGHVDFPTLFAARDRDLAERYEANLTRTNAGFLEAPGRLAERCIALLQDA